MYKYVLFAFTCLFFAGYGYNASVAVKKISVVGEQKIAQNIFDTSIVIFKSDPAYRLHMRYNDDLHTTILNFLYRDRVIFRDRLSSMFFIVQLNDMDNDGIKDLLIINFSSARSNESFHLYLVKEAEKKMIRVNGFEQVLNPVLNKKYNIIEGSALWGNSETCAFYRIKANKLTNLGYGYDHKVDDGDDEYSRSIKRILKKWGRK